MILFSFKFFLREEENTPDRYSYCSMGLFFNAAAFLFSKAFRRIDYSRSGFHSFFLSEQFILYRVLLPELKFADTQIART